MVDRYRTSDYLGTNKLQAFFVSKLENLPESKKIGNVDENGNRAIKIGEKKKKRIIPVFYTKDISILVDQLDTLATISKSNVFLFCKIYNGIKIIAYEYNVGHQIKDLTDIESTMIYKLYYDPRTQTEEINADEVSIQLGYSLKEFVKLMFDRKYMLVIGLSTIANRQDNDNDKLIRDFEGYNPIDLVPVYPATRTPTSWNS